MSYAVLPDMLKALVGFLTTHTALAPLHGGRVGTKLLTDLVAVRVASLGGPQPWPWQAEPQYQIEWWGARADVDEGNALTLCRTGEAALWDIANTAVTGGRVTGFSMPLSQFWQPDENTERPRFITQVALTAMP